MGTGTAQATGAVPFKAEYTAQIGFTGPTTVSWSGTGHGRLLGANTGRGDITITGGDDSCRGGLANVHVATLTAANGDSLTLTSVDVACPDPGNPYEFHGSGDWTVTGGTGRFAGATGHGRGVGHSNFATGAFEVSWTGSLFL